MYNLVCNEFYKMYQKKRIFVAFGILLIMIIVVAYGQDYTLNQRRENIAEQLGIEDINDWKAIATQQLNELNSRMDFSYVSDEYRDFLKVRVAQLQYQIDNDINPVDINSMGFASKFIEGALSLFLPFLIVLLAADLVCGEVSSGTIKLLLAGGVPRYKILLSKLIVLVVLSALMLLFSVLIANVVAGFFFEFGGWQTPVATGFKVVGGELITSSVVNVPQWKYLAMICASAYFVLVVVASITLMISTLVRSTSASIGIILSTIIGGSIVSNLVSDWSLPQYFFTAHLQLTQYISGSLRAVEGVDMAFSLFVLTLWLFGSCLVSFITFTKRDVLV